MGKTRYKSSQLVTDTATASDIGYRVESRQVGMRVVVQIIILVVIIIMETVKPFQVDTMPDDF
jgi:hypothetical protein